MIVLVKRDRITIAKNAVAVPKFQVSPLTRADTFGDYRTDPSEHKTGGIKMERIDERTSEQRKTHTWLVTATDKFMSGWGKCSNGLSKCAWACEPKNRQKVLNWVRNRKEMRYVNEHVGNWYPKNAEHVHIYIVNDGHPSLA